MVSAKSRIKNLVEFHLFNGREFIGTYSKEPIKQ